MPLLNDSAVHLPNSFLEGHRTICGVAVVWNSTASETSRHSTAQDTTQMGAMVSSPSGKERLPDRSPSSTPTISCKKVKKLGRKQKPGKVKKMQSTVLGKRKLYVSDSEKEDEIDILSDSREGPISNCESKIEEENQVTPLRRSNRTRKSRIELAPEDLDSDNDSDAGSEEEKNLVHRATPVIEHATEKPSPSPSPPTQRPSKFAKSSYGGKVPREVDVIKESKSRVVKKSKPTLTARSSIRGKAGSDGLESPQSADTSTPTSSLDRNIESSGLRKATFAVSSPCETSQRERPTVSPTSRLKPALKPYPNNSNSLSENIAISNPTPISESAMDESSASPIERVVKRRRMIISSDASDQDTTPGPRRSLRSTTRRQKTQHESDSSSSWGMSKTDQNSEIHESIEIDSYTDPLEHLKPPFYKHWDEKLGTVSARGNGAYINLTTSTSAANTAIPPDKSKRKGEDILYFAYGMDMSYMYMQKQFPGAKLVGIGVLTGGSGFRWSIGDNGYPIVRRNSSFDVKESNESEAGDESSEIEREVHGVVFRIKGSEYAYTHHVERNMRGKCSIEQVSVDVKVRLDNRQLHGLGDFQPAGGHVGAIIEDAYGVRRQLKGDVKVWAIIGSENARQETLDTASVQKGAAKKIVYGGVVYSPKSEDSQDPTESYTEAEMKRTIEFLMNRAIFEALQEGMEREYVERVLRRVFAYPKASILQSFCLREIGRNREEP